MLVELLKTATGLSLREPQETVRQAVDRLDTLTSNAPEKRRALEGFVLGAARALRSQLPKEVLRDLVDHLHTALSVSSSDLTRVLERPGPATQSLYRLTEEPLSLTVAGYPLTVRQYREHSDELVSDSLVVMMPGRPLGSFTDYLVEPLGGGTLLCVKSEDDLAVFYFEGEAESQPKNVLL